MKPSIPTGDRAINEGTSPLHVEVLAAVQLVFRVLEHYHCARSVVLSIISTGLAKPEEQTYPAVYLQSTN